MQKHILIRYFCTINVQKQNYLYVLFKDSLHNIFEVYYIIRYMYIDFHEGGWEAFVIAGATIYVFRELCK